MENDKRSWTFNAEAFAEAVRLAKLAAPRKTMLPIREGALLAVDAAGNATLRAADYHCGVERWLRLESAEGGPEGARWLPLKSMDAAAQAVLRGAKKGFSAGSVRVEWTPGENKLAFYRVPKPGEMAAVTQFSSPSGFPEEYPDPFKRLEGPAFSVSGDGLGEALKFVGKFAAPDSYGLRACRGPRIEATAEGVRVVATDGVRLAARIIPAEVSDATPDVAASLPREFARLAAEIWNAKRPGVPKLRFARGEGYGDGRLSLEDDETLVWCAPLDGTWPSIAAVIPKQWRWSAKLDRAGLLQALKRAKAVLKEAGRDDCYAALGPNANGRLCLRACHGGLAFSERLDGPPRSCAWRDGDPISLPGAPAVEFRPDHLEALLKGEKARDATLRWNDPDVSRLIGLDVAGAADGAVLAVNGRVVEGVFDAEPEPVLSSESDLAARILAFEPPVFADPRQAFNSALATWNASHSWRAGDGPEEEAARSVRLARFFDIGPWLDVNMPAFEGDANRLPFGLAERAFILRRLERGQGAFAAIPAGTRVRRGRSELLLTIGGALVGAD